MTCPTAGSSELQCTYRSRNENENSKASSLDVSLALNNTVLKSPGSFDKKKYRNNDFCIYNVDMHKQCKGNQIVVQATAQTDLKDIETSDGRRRCLDYLEFDFAPGHYLCGDELRNYTSPPLSISSFLAVFWTSRGNNKGRFEITARCTHIPIQSTDSSEDYSGDLDQADHSSSSS